MKNIVLVALLAISFFANAQQDDKKCETTEPAYLSRMPGFYISDCKFSEYNEKEFIYESGGRAVVVKKGGLYRELWYQKKQDETRKFSSAQIIKNYADAVLKIKGKVLADNKTFLTANIDGKEVFIEQSYSNSADAGAYSIRIIEIAQMQQDVVATMQESMDTQGKAVLYGILFEVGKSAIKSESVKELTQIIDYLSANVTVKIIVVGHTDNTGNYASNMTLSKARAESIKAYLINTGKIAAGRLISEGVGQTCPVSTNATDEGRKKNRRVEIVKQ